MTWPVTPLETGSGVTSTMRTSGLVSSRYACPLLRRYDTQGLASPCGRCLRRHGRPARPHRCELRTRPARRSVTGDPCLIRSCGWSSRRRRANPNYDWSLDWSRLAISVQPRTLGFQFSDPAFQRVNVLVEVEYREHRYAYVPAVPLELEPTNKLFLSLSLATLPNTRNVHPLMIAETDLDAARLKARLVAKPRRRQPADSCCGSRCEHLAAGAVLRDDRANCGMCGCWFGSASTALCCVLLIFSGGPRSAFHSARPNSARSLAGQPRFDPRGVSAVRIRSWLGRLTFVDRKRSKRRAPRRPS